MGGESADRPVSEERAAAGLGRVPYRVKRGARAPALCSLRRGHPGGDAAAGHGGPGSAQNLLLLLPQEQVVSLA